MGARLDPAIDAVIKHAKIMPWWISSPAGLSAGVHRNTKVYMAASKKDCMAPSSAMRVSPRMAAAAALNCVDRLTWGAQACGRRVRVRTGMQRARERARKHAAGAGESTQACGGRGGEHASMWRARERARRHVAGAGESTQACGGRGREHAGMWRARERAHRQMV
eukprot:362445-Chlamydomonas_euryale.AAC.2